MSPVAARVAATPARPASLPRRVADVGRLHLVAPVRSRARRAPFVVVVLTLLSIGLVGLIVLSTMLQAQSFEASALRSEAAALETQQQELGRDVARLQSPVNLEQRARRQGMVPNTNPAFLRLSDGKILGTPEPATRGGSR